MALTEVPPRMNDGRRDTTAASSRITGAADEPGHNHTVLTDADCARIATVLNASVGTPVRRLSARLLSGGRSNLTYALSDGKRSWVLRRPPLGHLLETAHDMRREFRVISALRHTDVPVPDAIVYCDDPDVIGTNFYIMALVEGRVLRTAEDMSRLSATEATTLGNAFIDALADLHLVDYRRAGLANLGRPDGYLERQLTRWNKQLTGSRSRDVPGFRALADRLIDSMPVTARSSIVHGDFRLDNAIVHPHVAGKILAILDWEMATLGDPLADLGLYLLYYVRDDAQTGNVGATISAEAGFLPRDDVVERYAQKSGRDVSQLDFYEALAAYKLAIILEGIHARFLMGKTVGEGFDHIGSLVEIMVQGALDQCSRSSIAALRG
jgi:aminoglycoside phosphotransferase (APT) family kinase protein